MVPKTLIFLACYLFNFVNGENKCQEPHNEQAYTNCVYKHQNKVLFHLEFDFYKDGPSTTAIKCNVQENVQELQFIKDDPELLPVDKSWINPVLYIGKLDFT